MGEKEFAKERGGEGRFDRVSEKGQGDQRLAQARLWCEVVRG